MLISVVGYIVVSGVKSSRGVRGYRVLVQSTKVSSFVERRIEAFLSQSHVRKHIIELTGKFQYFDVPVVDFAG